MVLGLPLATFTMLHVAISLFALIAGFAMLRDMLRGVDRKTPAIALLVLSFLTDVTGFLFPFTRFLPSHITGIVSLVFLVLALAGRDLFKLAGVWRPVYVISMVAAVYLNVFVAVAQLFLKVGVLHDLAPTGSEPPFAIAQGVVLVGFIVAGSFAVKKFHPQAAVA